MAKKCLECLVVDGNYSKERITLLALGLLLIAILIWLITLTIKVEHIDNKYETRTTIVHTTTSTTKVSLILSWEKIATTFNICNHSQTNVVIQNGTSLQQCEELANQIAEAKYFFYDITYSCIVFKTCYLQNEVITT